MRFDKTGHDFKVHFCSSITAIPANFSRFAGLVILGLICLTEWAHQLGEDLAHVKLARLELDFGWFFRVLFDAKSAVCFGLDLLLFVIFIYDRKCFPILLLSLVGWRAAGTSSGL